MSPSAALIAEVLTKSLVTPTLENERRLPRTPHQSGLGKRRINVGPRCRPDRVAVIGSDALIERITLCHGCAEIVEDRRGNAEVLADYRQWIGALSINVSVKQCIEITKQTLNCNW